MVIHQKCRQHIREREASQSLHVVAAHIDGHALVLEGNVNQIALGVLLQSLQEHAQFVLAQSVVGTQCVGAVSMSMAHILSLPVIAVITTAIIIIAIIVVGAIIHHNVPVHLPLLRLLNVLKVTIFAIHIHRGLDPQMLVMMRLPMGMRFVIVNIK